MLAVLTTLVVGCLHAAPRASVVVPSSPSTPSTSTTRAVPKRRLKILVLDVDSAELTASEKTTLANLEATHLADSDALEVISGDDLRRLMKLSAQAAEVGVNGTCTDACMAELAGALGAGVVVSTQAGKLGDTLVVTLAVFDAAKAKSVARKSITAQSIGELPKDLGPALDALVAPLLAFEATAEKRATSRVDQVFAGEGMQICTDPRDASAWWFCTRKEAVTENAFVRKYRALTGANDLDGFETFRVGDDMSTAAAAVTIGVAGAAVVGLDALCAGTSACGAGVQATLTKSDSSNLPPYGVVAPVTIGSISGIAGFLVGGLMLDSAIENHDGAPRDHALSEGEALAAVDRYNRALLAKLARELGPG